ncbi:MAG: hypothetical protein QM775_23545 [Pirellulales bacterium]
MWSLCSFAAGLCAMWAMQNAWSSVTGRPASDTSYPTVNVCFQQSELEARIRSVLKQPADFEFVDNDLDSIGEYLAKRYVVPVFIDRQHVEAEIGKSPADYVVSGRSTGEDLRRELAALLDPHRLAISVHHDRLVITSRSRADEVVDTRVYPVADLATIYGRSSAGTATWSKLAPVRSAVHFEPLIRAISGSVAPDTWREVGGVSGDILPLETDALIALVVTQTDAAHGEIERLLQSMRQARDLRVRDQQFERSLPTPAATTGPNHPICVGT